MTPPRILVLSYYVGAETQAASHHIDERLPELQRRGIQFEIISSVCGAKQRQYRHHRVVSALFADQFREMRHVARRTGWRRPARKMGLTLLAALWLPLYFVEKTLLPLRAAWSWSITAAAFGYFRCRKFRPQVIYATDSSAAAQLAALWVSRRTGIPFVCEFHDPIASLPKPNKKLQQRFAAWVERRTAENASRVIYLTKSAARSAQQRFPEQTAKITAIYPGFQPIGPAPAPADKPRKRILAHFGNLNGSRNIDPLIAAVDACRPDQWEVHLYGYLSGYVRAKIRDSRQPELFREHGTVRRGEALRRMLDADLLLLVQHAGAVSRETIPSKVHEYLQTGKSILAYTYDNGELDSLLREYGHHSANRREERGCVDLTREILSGKRAIGQPRRYSYNLGQSVDALLRELGISPR